MSAGMGRYLMISCHRSGDSSKFVQLSSLLTWFLFKNTYSNVVLPGTHTAIGRYDFEAVRNGRRAGVGGKTGSSFYHVHDHVDGEGCLLGNDSGRNRDNSWSQHRRPSRGDGAEHDGRSRWRRYMVYRIVALLRLCT